VPVAFHRLANPKRDMVWVALAGPAANIALAVLALLLLHLFVRPEMTLSLWVWYNLDNFIQINVVLACFNMLPIPPLDGGRIVTGLLPQPLDYRFARLEPYGLLLVLGMFVVLPLLTRQFGLEIDPLGMVLVPIVNNVFLIAKLVTGW
jgi:Zn-dependent protease